MRWGVQRGKAPFAGGVGVPHTYLFFSFLWKESGKTMELTEAGSPQVAIAVGDAPESRGGC